MPEPRLRLNSRLLPALVGLLLFLQLVTPYRGWMVLLVGLGGGWLVSFLWARALARNLRLIREMRFGWAQVGDRLQERFTLVNNGWAPALWVELTDHSSLPDYQVSRVTGVGTASYNQWHTDGVCTRRGLYTLGPTSLRTGDPLGLYTVSLHYPEASALMVTPPVVPLPAIEIAPAGRAGEGRRPRPDVLEYTVSASGVRDYQPGDNPSWIHWGISAHRDALFVRLFDSTPASDWWIFLDLDQRVQVGQGWDSSQEHGVILAASLADRGLRGGRAVGLVTHSEELVWLPPQAGNDQRLAILRALALVTPGSRSLAELLERVRPAFKQRASLVIITPAATHCDGNWIEALVPLLRRGVVPTALLLDPVSFGYRRPASAESEAGDGLAERDSTSPQRLELAGAVRKTLALLSDLGVARYVITRDLLDRAEARPGRQGQWEWRVSATGRAIAVRRPRDMGWKRLS